MANATATIGIKSSGFKRGLDEMQAMAQSWKQDIASTLAGGITFGAFLNFFNTFREEMGRVNDLSQRFGQTIQVIQQVGNVAKVSGTDIEQLASILTKLTLEASDSAEKFEKVGINAQDFIGAGYDQQLLMLAAAWEQSNGSIQGQIEFMQLLGAKGQDLLPMLSKGVAGLREELAGVPTVADDTVRSISAMNDAMEGFHTRVQVGLGRLIEWGKFAKDLAVSLFEGGSQKEMTDRLIDAVASRDTTVTAGMADPTAKAKIAEDQKKAAEDAKSIEEARLSLEERLQELARSRMSDEQKITDLKNEQAQHVAKAQDGALAEKDRLAAAEEIVRTQKEIEAIQQRIQKSKDDEAKNIADLEGKVAAKEDQQKLDGMTPAARAEELKKRQKALFDEASKAQEDGDRKAAAQKRLEALNLADDIKKTEKEMADEKERLAKEKNPLDPSAKGNNSSVVSSSLGAIGGGGGVYIGGGDPMLTESRRQTDLLSQIARNTGGGAGAPPSANPF